MNTRKKSAILLSLYLFIFSMHKTNNVTINDAFTLDSDTYFSTYNDFKIYIASENKINEIIKENTKDVYIMDCRCDDDPNVRICDSCEIKDLKEMSYILKMLNEYEKLYPSEWNRTYTSMLIEWIIHNISYDYDFEQDSARHVDLNNADESILHLVKRVEKNTK